jgi:putative nucleotidyltransferase with HDIG domain
MKISCPHCSKEYHIPDERLSSLAGNKEDIMLPCPNCKGIIGIRVGELSGKADGSAPDGTALKQRILRSLKDIPPMPQVAQKARQLVSKPNSSFSDLAKVIETDQAIVARILKIANSPFYGLSGKVSSVQHAASVLGTRTLMDVLNMACSSEILGKTLAGYNLDAGELWSHSLAVALGSQVIARRINPDLEQDAFSAGLIHDVGKIILDPYVRERKDAFQAFVDEGNRTFLNAEKHILGFDHAELASEVCEKWQIPAGIVEAIKHHHDPVAETGNILQFIVHTADAVAIMSGIGAGMDGMLYALHPDALKVLNLKSEDISVFMGQIADYVEKTTQEM